MVIFHSYVSLPEGNAHHGTCDGTWIMHILMMEYVVAQPPRHEVELGFSEEGPETGDRMAMTHGMRRPMTHIPLPLKSRYFNLNLYPLS